MTLCINLIYQEIRKQTNKHIAGQAPFKKSRIHRSQKIDILSINRTVY